MLKVKAESGGGVNEVGVSGGDADPYSAAVLFLPCVEGEGEHFVEGVGVSY